MKRLLLLVVLLLTLTSGHILAQDDGGHTDTLVISWPPPVTEVWGVGDVLGTANIPGMAYYFLEYMPLSDDLSIPENAPWLPGTLVMQQPVTNGVLATLDTTQVADGLYALRLTAATADGQSYHYLVTPIRVDNARFQAFEARIRAEGGQAATVTPVPTTAPADTTPRVTPSATAVNVRRCDLVDNDRCPIIAQLPPGQVAEITGRNPANTFYQVRLASGVSGWASRTVVFESGNVSSVPVVNPPAPLPVAVQPILPVGVVASSVIPNGMSIQGSAVCSQPFNVQINLANTGSTVSPAGSLTLQDSNISTGTVTFSGSASYPAINPGGNFVVVIPVTTSVYYGEQHQLRAFTNSREFAITYTLGQGSCNAAPTPAQPTGGQRSFGAGECTLVLSSAEVSARPEGEVTFVISETGTYPASQVQVVGGLAWYQISFADAPGWVPGVNVTSYQGNCNP
ncbi:MAG: hypothetical protein L6Q98_25115 [Anaerolineae bacterium]|nr:hypothetical protein [Anaerolineae bacterium]NUQ07324.1 hypothetical protein [Anaerolineae bacterium]